MGLELLSSNFHNRINTLANPDSPNNNAMHAKPDLRVEFVHSGHLFRLGDLGRYLAFADCFLAEVCEFNADDRWMSCVCCLTS